MKHGIVEEKTEVVIMGQLIGCLIAGYLCIYLPWKASQKEESRRDKICIIT